MTDDHPNRTRPIQHGKAARLRVVGLAVIAVYTACSRPPASDTGTAGSTTAVEAPRAARGKTPWQPNTTHSYDVNLENTTTLGGGILAEFKLRGTLELHSRQVDDGVQFAARLSGAKFDVPDETVRANFDALGEELGKYLSFEFADAKLGEIRLPPDASPFAVSLSRTLVAALQISLPPDADTLRWTTTEHDASGDYQAEYTRTPGSTRVGKRKLNYGQLALGAVRPDGKEATLSTKVIESNGFVDLVADEAVAVSYDEVLGIDSFPGTPARAKTSLTLKLQHSGPLTIPLDWVGIESGTRPVQRVTRDSGAALDPRYDAQRIGEFTFETALAELERQSRDPERHQIGRSQHEHVTAEESHERRQRLDAQGRVFSAMAAILRSAPESIPKAMHSIRRNSTATGLLLNALGTAGNPPAQAALVELMDDGNLTSKVRRGAAYALIRTPNATPSTVSALMRHLAGGPLQQHALYGLGTIGRGLQESGQQARADAIARALVERLGGATLDVEKVATLRAIANSANSLALPAVEPYLASDDPRLRSAAVDAVRLMKHPKVDGLIAERLTSDSARGVQLAAVEAIKVREPSDVLAKALTTSVSANTKTNVKLEAVEVLAKWLPSRPQTRQDLLQIAAQSEHAPVRAAARRALAE